VLHAYVVESSAHNICLTVTSVPNEGRLFAHCGLLASVSHSGMCNVVVMQRMCKLLGMKVHKCSFVVPEIIVAICAS